MLLLGLQLQCQLIKWDIFIKLNACFHWLLKIRNWKQSFVCFQFPSQFEFWEQFLFFVHFKLPNKFFRLKNRKLFLETKNKGKNSYQTYPKISSILPFFIPSPFFILSLFHPPNQIDFKSKQQNLCEHR